MPAPELELLRSEKLNVNPDLSDLNGDCLELCIDGMEGMLTLSDSSGLLIGITVSSDEVSFSLPDGRVKSAACRNASELRLFVDRCSVECFVNDGVICFSERIYPNDNHISYRLEGSGDAQAWKLNSAFEN